MILSLFLLFSMKSVSVAPMDLLLLELSGCSQARLLLTLALPPPQGACWVGVEVGVCQGQPSLGA